MPSFAQMPSPFFAQPDAVSSAAPFSGLNSRVGYSLEQVGDRLDEGLQTRIGRQRQRPGAAGAGQRDVDDLLAVDEVAERPADVGVGEGLALVVDVERGRPPVDVAVGRFRCRCG